MKAVGSVLALALLASPAVVRSAPLPEAGQVALEAFFDGCLDPVGARHDPGPPMAKALAPYKPDAAPAPDATHPEHKLWRVRALDGDLEFEVLSGKAWCEVRLIGADPAQTARRVNTALGRLDIPMQRKSLGGEAGVQSEAVIMGHGDQDGLVVVLRQVRDPKDGEPGLTVSVSPARFGKGQ